MELIGEVELLRTSALSSSEGKTLQHTSGSILTISADSHTLQVVLQAVIPVLGMPGTSFLALFIATKYACAANDDEEAKMNEFITLLMRRGLLLRVDRMYKKPKPGKKRLTKWPKKLVPVKDKSMLVT